MNQNSFLLLSSQLSQADFCWTAAVKNRAPSLPSSWTKGFLSGWSRISVFLPGPCCLMLRLSPKQVIQKFYLNCGSQNTGPQEPFSRSIRQGSYMQERQAKKTTAPCIACLAPTVGVSLGEKTAIVSNLSSRALAEILPVK